MRSTLHAALAILVLVLGAVAVHADRLDESSAPSSTTSASLATTTTAATTTTVAPTTTTTTTTTSTTTAPPPTTVAPSTTTTVPGLRQGATGPEVLALEQRLDELGYFVGTVDGTYDGNTAHGVTAFQKVSGLGRDGVVGPATEAALTAGVRPVPRGTDGRGLEIDLTHQVLLVVDGGTVQKVLDVSTGKTAGLTPSGHFTLYRQIDGWRHAPLGVLYRPKYYYKGLAIHGYSSVPAYPASHGCIRVTNAEMDWLWASGSGAIGTPLWIY